MSLRWSIFFGQGNTGIHERNVKLFAAVDFGQRKDQLDHAWNHAYYQPELFSLYTCRLVSMSMYACNVAKAKSDVLVKQSGVLWAYCRHCKKKITHISFQFRWKTIWLRLLKGAYQKILIRITFTKLISNRNSHEGHKNGINDNKHWLLKSCIWFN